MYDVLSVVGLVVGIASVWYAWHLARRQLRADFRKAADEAVDRVVQLVLGGDQSDAVRFLREADRALNEKDWEKGELRLADAASAIARISSNVRLTADERKALTDGLAEINGLLIRTREHSRSTKNRGHMPPELLVKLVNLVSELERLRGRLMSGVQHRPKAEDGNG